MGSAGVSCCCFSSVPTCRESAAGQQPWQTCAPLVASSRAALLPGAAAAASLAWVPSQLPAAGLAVDRARGGLCVVGGRKLSYDIVLALALQSCTSHREREGGHRHGQQTARAREKGTGSNKSSVNNERCSEHNRQRGASPGQAHKMQLYWTSRGGERGAITQPTHAPSGW